MDTRNKIVSAPGPELARPLAVAVGYFDVLRAGHARELQQAKDAAGAATLVAIVLPGTGTLLPQRARAELVAALRAVDCVVVAAETDDVEGLLAALGPADVLHLEEADERRVRELREHVRSRSRNG